MIERYKHILIYGYGTSGKAVESVLSKLKKQYKIYDDNIKIQGGNYISTLTKNQLSLFDLIVLSPGVSIYNKNIVLAKKMGLEVVSELEFGFWFCKCKTIAVTGTNGKTTTVSLITELLSNAGYKVKSFGNIGEPLTYITEHKNLDYAVIEVSSFQLESCHTFKPNISILLNIDQDHIDRHKTFENYIKTKFKLFSNNSKNSITILNGDDENITKNLQSIKGKSYFLSLLNSATDVYSLNGNIYSNIKTKDELLFKKEELVNSKTFLVNLMAVAVIFKLLNIKKEVFLKTINNFNWLSDRMEEAGIVGGVKYINDSKATNIHAVNGAVKSISPQTKIHLLLGGQNKKLNFDEFLKNLPPNVETIILFGQARNYIHKSAKKNFNGKSYIVKDLQSAVVLSSAVAQSGDIVLFSPACASFDAYLNYKKRGQHFKELVKNLNSLNKEDILKKYFK